MSLSAAHSEFNDELSTTSGGDVTKENSKIIVKWSTNPNAPLILLFGWAGCRDRYLAKYSQIYEANGCSVLRFIVPVAKIKCYSSYRQFAIKVFDRISNVSVEELHFPIFFHVFSMNGCSLFSSMWDLMATSDKGEAVKRMVKGIIFDSCPANVMPWQGADAVSFAMMPPSLYGNAQRAVYRYLLTGVFSIHRAFIWLRSMFEADLYEQHFSYFHMLKFTDLPNRQLYLYSKADTICSAKSIEFFRDHHQAQRKENVEFFWKCWEDSMHVEHLRKYPKEYTAECLRFVGVERESSPPLGQSLDNNSNVDKITKSEILSDSS